MLRFTYILLALFLLFSVNKISAGPVEMKLSARITEILNLRLKKEYGDAISQHITILTPAEKLAQLCPQPELTVPHNNRLTGNLSIAVRCGNQRRFIQVKVEAEGEYWVAARLLQPRQAITRADIKPHYGPLENIASGTLFRVDQILGRVTTRLVNEGQPLVKSQLRQQWQVTTGKEVEVIAGGEGFRIRSKGKAMNNAAVHQSLKVRMKSGQIVSGILTPQGSVRLDSKS